MPDLETLPAGLQSPMRRLQEILRGYGSLLTAWSGGVDSTLLAFLAHQVLGPKALAVTARSPSLAPEEWDAIVAWAAQMGLAHRAVETRELDNPHYAANSTERCFFCKGELMEVLAGVAHEGGFAKIALGANLDDLSDFRPGERAAAQRGAVFPLREAGLNKTQIRELSRALGLPTAEKPAGACLASRIPFGQEITAGKLGQVARAEAFLHQAGFPACRVRHHGPVARIEVPEALLPRLLQIRHSTVEALKREGFVFVTLDLQGLRSGSLHEALPKSSSAPPENGKSS